MWAYQLDAPMHFVRRQVDEPSASALVDGQVLLRFRVGGVCGSDIPRCREGFAVDAPNPLGWSLHEIVGDVVATSADLAVGERVVGWVADCTGLRELVPTPANELVAVDGALDDAHAVALQPLACVLYALERLGDITGARAAIIGLGPIGLLFAHALADKGAASIVGVDPVDRSDAADAFHLDEVVQRTSHSWARSVPPGSYDLVVEAVGHQVGTMDDAIAVAATNGTVLYFGNPDDLYYPVRFGTMMDRNLTLRAGRTPRPDRRGALRLAQSYAAKHPTLLDDYVSHVLPVSDAQRAYDMASRPAVGQRKIVLDATR